MLPASAPSPLAPHQRLASKIRQECRRLLTPTVLRGYGCSSPLYPKKTPGEGWHHGTAGSFGCGAVVPSPPPASRQAGMEQGLLGGSAPDLVSSSL